MRDFKHIAQLVKTRRNEIAMPQTELSQRLGYKNGQFISNVERGLCSIPLKKIKLLAEILKIEPVEVSTAVVRDFSYTVQQHIQ